MRLPTSIPSSPPSLVRPSARSQPILHAMKTLFLILAMFFLASSAWPADVYVEKAAPHKPCGLKGGAPANTDKAQQNVNKNRWHPPLPADFDNRVTAQALVQPGNDQTRWSNKRAARIRGYVAIVKLGTSGESCNCGAKAPVDSDTHIALVADSTTSQDKRTYVIVEVTPRIREDLAAQNPSIDWSTDALKKRLLGNMVPGICALTSSDLFGLHRESRNSSIGLLPSTGIRYRPNVPVNASSTYAGFNADRNPIENSPFRILPSNSSLARKSPSLVCRILKTKSCNPDLFSSP
jgi:hypothetical protein